MYRGSLAERKKKMDRNRSLNQGQGIDEIAFFPSRAQASFGRALELGRGSVSPGGQSEGLQCQRDQIENSDRSPRAGGYIDTAPGVSVETFLGSFANPVLARILLIRPPPSVAAPAPLPHAFIDPRRVGMTPSDRGALPEGTRAACAPPAGCRCSCPVLPPLLRRRLSPHRAVTLSHRDGAAGRATMWDAHPRALRLFPRCGYFPTAYPVEQRGGAFLAGGGKESPVKGAQN